MSQQRSELKPFNHELTFSRGVAAEAMPQVQTATARACGKAIIVGEHAVVYGAKAVAMPLLNHKMQVRLCPSLNPSELKLVLEGRELSAQISNVVNDAFLALNLPKFGLTIEGKHTLPIGAGLGSSATLCVIILRAICRAVDREISSGELAILANQMERRFHGNPSGLDTSVVAYEQTIAFRRSFGAEPITPANSWHFVLIDSGVRSSTMSMIKTAEPYFKSQLGERRLTIFDNLGTQVVDGLLKGDELSVADAMNHASAMLACAGVVNEPLNNIINACLAEGALAAKPTGAGGGGSVIALFSRDKSREQVAKLRQTLENLSVFEVPLL